MHLCPLTLILLEDVSTRKNLDEILDSDVESEHDAYLHHVKKEGQERDEMDEDEEGLCFDLDCTDPIVVRIKGLEGQVYGLMNAVWYFLEDLLFSLFTESNKREGLFSSKSDVPSKLFLALEVGPRNIFKQKVGSL